MADELTSTADPELQLAQTTLAGLLEKMKVTTQVSAHWVEPEETDSDRPIWLDVQGDDLSFLIGRRGETLAALQYITRLILSKELDRAVSVIIDVEGYKKRREEQLRRMARRAADQAVEQQRSVLLEPMPANERRLIHLELRNHPNVFTESEGEGDRRKVKVIFKP